MLSGQNPLNFSKIGAWRNWLDAVTANTHAKRQMRKCRFDSGRPYYLYTRNMPKKLHVDIETFSSADIASCGAYKYIESDDFEILLIAYALDDEPIKIIDLAQGELIPEEFVEAMNDPEIEKWAHNAVFERLSFAKYGFNVPVEQWYCSAVKAAYCGLPLSLDGVSKAMQLEEKGKLSTGKALIRYFSIPCKPSKANNMRERNLPKHDLEKWSDFKRYCINDVEAEREICRRLEGYNIPEFDRLTYLIDQHINDTGVLVDINMANNAVRIDAIFKEEISSKVKELTGLENPNSPAQLKAWLNNATGKSIQSLAKDSVQDLLKEIDAGAASDVLKGRALMAKSSTKKYNAMLSCACKDSRAHGLFQFYGAMRTGRWAGRLIQLQNLPQNHMPDLDLARSVISDNDYDLAEMLYGNIPTVLSELIRTALIAPEGHVFAVADFSAIEARVLSWLAGEEWRLDVFRTHGKIYEASASMMFGVPIESIGKGSPLRQKGKVAELALGYEGSVGALKTMGGERMGLSVPEMKIIVDRWRKANPKIVKLWADIDKAAKRAVESKKPYRLRSLLFECDDMAMTIQLPSGRKLFYQDAKMGSNRFGNASVIYKGMNQETKKWEDLETYGGKLTENIIQGISRDLLALAMAGLYRKNYKMVLHVHDEVACEVESDMASAKLDDMCKTMCIVPDWAAGLPLNAAGYITPFYKKD